MLGGLLGAGAGAVLKTVLSELKEARRDQLNAKNNEARVEADVRIAELEARANVLIAEQASGHTRWIRPVFAAPFAIYNAKVLVWDLTLGLGSTPSLGTEMAAIEATIIGAYFFGRPFEKYLRSRK